MDICICISKFTKIGDLISWKEIHILVLSDKEEH